MYQEKCIFIKLKIHTQLPKYNNFIKHLIWKK